MSAERSTESIIDLLYGELSEDEAAEMREEFSDAPELQAEFAEFESLLGRVREVMPLQEVSPSIHESIMAAARVAVEQPDEDRMIRRGPPPQEQSFWGRIGRGQGSQIALVAAVLIAGLFVVRGVEKSSSPLNAPASDISAMREAAPAMAAPEVQEEEAAVELDEAQAAKQEMPGGGGEGGEAVADQWTAESDAPSEPEPEPVVGAAAEKPSDAEASLRAELERSRDRAKAPANRAPVAKRGKKKRSKPKPAAKSSLSTKSSGETVDLFKDSKQDSAMYDLLGGDDDGSSYGSGSTSSASPTRTVQGKGGMDIPQPDPAPPAQAQAEDKKEREYRPAANSISEVTTYFRKNDYAGTIRAADKFLASSKSAPRTERASALHMKAQALEKQGKYDEADRIYSSIQKNYPGFQSAQIQNSRRELQNKRAPRKSPKRKAKKAMEVKEAAPSADVFSE